MTDKKKPAKGAPEPAKRPKYNPTGHRGPYGGGFDVDRWEKFGDWVKEVRLSRRSKINLKKWLTVAEASKRAKLSKTHWTNIESGITAASEEAVKMIAEALEISEAEALQKAGYDGGRGKSARDVRLDALPIEMVSMVDDLIDKLEAMNQKQKEGK